MKKLISMLLSVVICVGCLAGCAGDADNKSSTAAVSWNETNQYVIGGIEFCLPSNAEENTGEDEDPFLYRTFDCGEFGFSCQFFEDEVMGPSTEVSFGDYNIEGDYTIDVNSITCRYFKMNAKDNGEPMVRLCVNSSTGCVAFCFYSNNDSTYLIDNMKEFSKTIKNNIPYEEETTTEAATTNIKDNYTKKITIENVSFYVPNDARVVENDNGIHTFYYTDWGFFMLQYVEGKYLDFDDIEETQYVKNLIDSFKNGLTRDGIYEIVDSFWTKIDDHSVYYVECKGEYSGKQVYTCTLLINCNTSISALSYNSLEDAKTHSDEISNGIRIGEPTENQLKSWEEETTDITTTQPSSNYTIGEENAMESAMSYIDLMSFSKAGLFKQLTSEYGEGYTEQEANKAISYLEKNGLVNWKEEAVEAAQDYLRISSYSRDGLYRQLTSEYGEQFTAEEAEYALSKVGY